MPIKKILKKFNDKKFVDCIHIHDNNCFFEALI